MPTDRPFVLTIAGFDPCSGAGVLADIKTFEQHAVQGMAVITGNTIQSEDRFLALEWIPIAFVSESIQFLFQKYAFKVVKIGVVPSLIFLHSVLNVLHKLAPEVLIIWDTVLKSSSRFDFMTMEDKIHLPQILKKITLVTPNYEEITQLHHSALDNKQLAEKLSEYCAVLLKGGHNQQEPGTDYLFQKGRVYTLLPHSEFVYQKHGSGCVLSSAIAANLALGEDLFTACQKAKQYTENFLNSHPSRIGYHYA